MSTTNKIILGTAGCVLAVLVLWTAFQQAATTARRAVDEVRIHSVPTVSALQDMRFGVARIIASTTEWLLLRSSKMDTGADQTSERELIDQGQAIFAAAMRRFREHHTRTGPRRREGGDVIATRIIAAYDAMIGVSRELIALSERGSHINEIVELKEDFEDKEMTVLEIIDTRLAKEQKISEAALERNILRLNDMGAAMNFLGVITAAVLIVYGFYIFKVVRTLSENKARLQAILDYSPTKIHIKDTEGRYLLVNSEAEKLFGVTEEEARGKTTHEIFPDKQAAVFGAHDQAVLEAGQTITEEEQWALDNGVHT